MEKSQEVEELHRVSENKSFKKLVAERQNVALQAVLNCPAEFEKLVEARAELRAAFRLPELIQSKINAAKPLEQPQDE